MLEKSSPLARVTETSQIAISYSMRLMDETEIDKTEPGELFEFTMGDGSLIPNLESLLVGLEQGTSGKFFVPPEDGFGYPDPANVYDLDKTEFPEGMALKLGDVVGFDTPTGEQIPGTVVGINDAKIKVDFNHPLAGETFIFEATIEKIN
ncbi:FKBP-type peptidyl-prolyl cis-trans isomerase [Thiomicrospira microaerophila]|uniref:FKBP-type peptidyl-prolyl cis-trans isomerase n=1 Tax=Thiomicrospira microaerophila TaxID=406020 RepID=UPI00200D5723|nr:FKBP-type peptidyl-prolyl cis-trans isomerase [Thiomicrospira microaerophila]UQB41400.1 FKBP-type peptidyl-prolyl cis-trans isomerase [Thiomicrospira microaerophila]